MNRILALLLTATFSLNLLGPIVIFKVRQIEARREAVQQIKAGLPDAHLTEIFIKKENLNKLLWLGDDEFRFRGKMYDVVKAQRDPKGNMRYSCYDDSLESFLYARLVKQVKNSEKNQKNRSAAAKTAVKFLSRENSYSIVKNTDFPEEKTSPFSLYSFSYNAPTLKIPGPPPRLV